MSEQLIRQLVWAVVMIGSTTFVHGIFIALIGMVLRRPDRPGALSAAGDAVRLVFVTLWMGIAHSVSTGMWAALYMVTEVSVDLEAALYFALATYTTLGFGDVLAPDAWRLLTGIAAANGLILFGLTAAVTVDATERLRLGRRRVAD